MGDKTGIEWTDATWNPVSGCSKVSQGCKHCYAERVFARPYPGRAFTDVRTHENRLDQPLRWAKGRNIFVNSMSDLFHENVPFEFIASVFAVMSVTTRHTYQVLTKRPERAIAFFDWVHGDQLEDEWSANSRIFDHWPKQIPWKPQHDKTKGGYDNCGPLYPYENVQIGVSVENQETADERIPLLLKIPAAIRFLSCEPLLGAIDLRRWLPCKQGGPDNCSKWALPPTCGQCDPRRDDACWIKARSVDWVIVGGESGHKARPMHPQWATDLRDQCIDSKVPFFFKQWGEWSVSGVVEGRHLGDDMRDGVVTFVQADREPDGHFKDGDEIMRKVGKKEAGRLLEGRTWDQFPTSIKPIDREMSQ